MIFLESVLGFLAVWGLSDIISKTIKYFQKDKVSEQNIDESLNISLICENQQLKFEIKQLKDELDTYDSFQLKPKLSEDQYNKNEFNNWFQKLLMVDNPCFFRDILRAKKDELWNQYMITADEYEKSHQEFHNEGKNGN